MKLRKFSFLWLPGKKYLLRYLPIFLLWGLYRGDIGLQVLDVLGQKQKTAERNSMCNMAQNFKHYFII